jgi:hypothetical protein
VLATTIVLATLIALWGGLIPLHRRRLGRPAQLVAARLVARRSRAPRN